MHLVQCYRRFFGLCFSILFVAHITISKPEGTPIEACEDMSPQHFVRVQTSICPFFSTPDRNEMWSNGTVQVILKHKRDSDSFKGFLIMAFDNTGSDSTPIGTFSSDLHGKAIDCRNDGTKNAVTHIDKSPKNSVVVIWIPPEDFDGSVVFKTTFLMSFEKYWVRQSSSSLRIKRANVIKEDSPSIATVTAVNSSDVEESDDSSETRSTAASTATICNTAECINQKLQSRLNTMERAFRMLLLSLSSQTNDLFTPVKEMLALDPAVKLIMSETPNFPTFSSNESHISNASFEHTTKDDNYQEKNTAVDSLRGSVKCSLADFVDINAIDVNPKLNQSSQIVLASLNNESLEITWPVHSAAECLKYISGVWIRVYQSGDEYKLPVETALDSTSDSVWRCPRQHYTCYTYQSCIHISNYICDGGMHCNDHIDEKYCDSTVCNNDGFRCGRQCVTKELVCDGKYDCLDGSDESDCNNTSSCEQLTNPSGHISSVTFSKPAPEIHPSRVSDAIRKTIVLISVQPSHQIWLTFDKFATVTESDFLKVYDGPYSNSPLLLSHSGSTIPPSVRSSSNELFLVLPSYYDPNYGIEAYYTSIVSMAEPFVSGCGGYIYGDGIISSPNYLSDASSMVDCFWFIEARNSEDTILLRKHSSNTPRLSAAVSHQVQPPLTVYDGWSTDGLVLFDENSTAQEAVIYSVSNKMMVHLKPPKVKENHVFYWNTSQISTPKCKKFYEETSGTIKSPNYPMLYPHMTDCRWTITVKPGSKVRLLFAFFETQKGADFISVYDGSTVYSKLLLTKSGSVPTPFLVNSSSNQVLVRFTSDADTSLPGFLAVYSDF